MANNSNSLNPHSRRSFLFGLAAAAAVPALPVNVAGQQTEAAPSAEADALMQTVRLRYGKYLEDGDTPLIERGIERVLRSTQEVLKVNIHNGDAPDCVFHPDGA